jgi:hypothetical protein
MAHRSGNVAKFPACSTRIPKKEDLTPEEPAKSQFSAFEKSNQLNFDLFQPPPVGFALFFEQWGDFRRELHLRFRELLDFEVHHFLDQSDKSLRSHKQSS